MVTVRFRPTGTSTSERKASWLGRSVQALQLALSHVISMQVLSSFLGTRTNSSWSSISWCTHCSSSTSKSRGARLCWRGRMTAIASALKTALQVQCTSARSVSVVRGTKSLQPMPCLLPSYLRQVTAQTACQLASKPVRPLNGGLPHDLPFDHIDVTFHLRGAYWTWHVSNVRGTIQH